MIDTERLGALLDRGEALFAANRHARMDLTEAEATLKEATAELGAAEAAVPRYRGPEEGRAALNARVNGKRTKCGVLAASIARKRTAHAELARRVQLWIPYCDALKTLAKKHGVEL